MTALRFCSIILAASLAACGAPDPALVEEGIDYSSLPEIEVEEGAPTESPVPLPDPNMEALVEQGESQAQRYQEYRENLDKMVRENEARELERRVDELERQQRLDKMEEAFGR